MVTHDVGSAVSHRVMLVAAPTFIQAQQIPSLDGVG